MVLSEYPLNPKELRKYNLRKYKCVPPSWELIEEVIAKSGIKRLAIFEYVWLMPRSTLTWYKTGIHVLAPKYWHIFYDFDAVSKKHHTKKHSKVTEKSTYILSTNKSIINGIREIANKG